MNLIDITPVMTSNTSPAPYIVTGNGLYSSNYDYYKAFNNTLIDVYDAWTSKSLSGTIMIDMGSSAKLDAFSIVAANEDSTTRLPVRFAFFGSDDGVNFVELRYLDGQIDWVKSSSRLFKLPETVSYRFYRLSVYNAGSESFTKVGLIKLYKLEETNVNTNRGSQSSNVYLLPSNSKHNLDNRKDDPREGLLAYVNDNNKYGGELRLLNKTGMFNIPKSGSIQRLLFDGNLIVDSVKLIDNIYNYNYLVVNSALTDGTYSESRVIPVEDILLNTKQNFAITSKGSETNYYYISYSFKDDTSIRIDLITSIGTWQTIGCCISSVYGLV